MHSVVQNLMEAPIAYAEPLLKNFGAAEINVRARAFCSAVATDAREVPVQSRRDRAGVAGEVTALLRPNTGSLWKFYNDALAGRAAQAGNQYVPKPDGSVKLAPGLRDVHESRGSIRRRAVQGRQPGAARVVHRAARCRAIRSRASA